jgi:integrase
MIPDPVGPDVTAAIARYAPRSLRAEVAAFSRDAVAGAAPQNPARAKALLFAVGKLGTFAVSVGLELRPDVVFHQAVIERFIALERASLGPATARTIRSNLRFVAHAVLAPPSPAPLALSRERSKAPYSGSEIEAYLALADAQPTAARARRLGALICLGAGAGLMGADLRAVRGVDVARRSGGMVVCVVGTRPRVVPVLARYHERLAQAADFAGTGYVIGGYSASRRNVTSALVASVAGGIDLATLDTSRLRATWLTSCAQIIGLKGFMDAAGIVCTQRLGDLVVTLEPLEEESAVALLGGHS